MIRKKLVLVSLIGVREGFMEGDQEIHLPTNLPSRISAVRVAEPYRKRWTLEHASNELTMHLRCEFNTLGYPKAALFAFCVAICSYNLLAAVKGASSAVGQRTDDPAVNGVGHLVVSRRRRMDAVACSGECRLRAGIRRSRRGRIVVYAVEIDVGRDQEDVFGRAVAVRFNQALHNAVLIAAVLVASLAATIVGAEGILRS